MSVLKLNNLQIGQSATATNNFTWYQPTSPDGTLRLGLGNGQATSQDLITVNSAGNLGLGVTPSAWNSSYKAAQIGTTAALYSPASGNGSSALLSNSYVDGSGNNIYLTTGYAHAFFQSFTGRQQFWSADSGTAGTTATFTSILSIRKGYTTVLQGGSESTGTGIAFPATQSASSDANTLDDYEEGTWTPVVSDGTTDCTMSALSVGFYVKIGRVVTLTGFADITTGIAGSNPLRIKGLPFTNNSSQGMQTAGCVGYFYNTNIPIGAVPALFVDKNFSHAVITKIGSANNSGVVIASEFGTGDQMAFSITYQT